MAVISVKQSWVVAVRLRAAVRRWGRGDRLPAGLPERVEHRQYLAVQAAARKPTRCNGFRLLSPC